MTRCSRWTSRIGRETSPRTTLPAGERTASSTSFRHPGREHYPAAVADRRRRRPLGRRVCRAVLGWRHRKPGASSVIHRERPPYRPALARRRSLSGRAKRRPARELDSGSTRCLRRDVLAAFTPPSGGGTLTCRARRGSRPCPCGTRGTTASRVLTRGRIKRSAAGLNPRASSTRRDTFVASP